MIKKCSLIGAIVLAAALTMSLLAPPASAASPTEAVLAGRGVLDAHGDGLIAVKGRIDLRVSSDRGVLLVKDIAGDATVDVDGTGGSAEFHGFKVYFGNGSAHIVGSDVAVIVVGKDLRLHVVGRGWAYLKGDGQFTVNNRGPFPWNRDGNFAPVGADETPAP